ncbi:putative mannose-1-phosphate guanyltransferase [Neolecta irregularis DAH-3]|uniref:mannose-1-phosphate guanylyltransferase n=1 Tax=Neolecta irregularis (strain DAH-3) TaxID=1198029 RepID=A0A1U7LNY3_NEOID|nr:putative mannose-1-phosphate guanyltransferase [Neolecta irregularis DAH-3]|eukprot:OLL24365.1 putative mannose-1-phosphate guanyltransferase [Neolecta irregularis DAH-3]
MTSTAILLVGGPSRGTRFRPLSMDIPKPLFPVAGHCMIWHHLRALSKLPSVVDVLLIGFYEEAVFRDFIRAASAEFTAMTIRYLREYQALGTAGGLYLFRDAILKSSPKHIFSMIKLHQERKAVGTVLGTKVSPESAASFGCIVSDPITHEILHYVEKPESYISSMINCGVYVFDSSIFAEIKKAMDKKEETKNPLDDNVDDKLRLEQDILAPLAEGKRLFVYETKDFWRQIKSASSAVPANALYLQRSLQSPSNDCLLTKPKEGGPEIVEPVYIHPSATVDPSAKIGPNVSIGQDVKVGAGVRIKDAIILDGTEIKAISYIDIMLTRKHDSCILHSILSECCKIGAWSRIEGTPTLASQHDTTVIKQGTKVQSITILAKDVVVGDEIRCQNVLVLPHKEIRRDVSCEVIM